jgi:hypothetical protein
VIGFGSAMLALALTPDRTDLSAIPAISWVFAAVSLIGFVSAWRCSDRQ